MFLSLYQDIERGAATAGAEGNCLPKKLSDPAMRSSNKKPSANLFVELVAESWDAHVHELTTSGSIKNTDIGCRDPRMFMSNEI